MEPARAAEVLEARLEELGTSLAARESAHADSLDKAWKEAERLHAEIAAGLGGFHRGWRQGGHEHLQIDLSAPRLDAKHARAVELELRRGRHCAIVTVKSKGEVTLVGPFRTGKNEGPCRSFPFAEADSSELDAALADFLVSFLEEAASP